MDENQINDIEVNGFVELSPSKETMRDIEIAKAKQLLKDNGYFVDNLWQTCDVTMNYDCTEEEAHNVLKLAFANEYIYEQIWNAIGQESEYMNLKHRDL